MLSLIEFTSPWRILNFNLTPELTIFFSAKSHHFGSWKRQKYQWKFIHFSVTEWKLINCYGEVNCMVTTSYWLKLGSNWTRHIACRGGAIWIGPSTREILLYSVLTPVPVDSYSLWFCTAATHFCFRWQMLTFPPHDRFSLLLRMTVTHFSLKWRWLTFLKDESYTLL